MITVTDVKIKNTPYDTVVGYANVIINNCFVINNIRIVKGKERLFVSFPSQKGKDGKYHNLAHPINQETRQYLETEILKAYHKQKSTI